MRIRTVSFLFLVYWSVGLVQGQGKGKGKGNGGNDGDKGDNDNNVPVCPPVDQDGTLLEEPSSGDGFLTCSYPAAGSCTYVDGTFVSGSATTCPPGAEQDPVSSSAIPSTSISTSGSNSASAQLTYSALFSLSTTEQAPSQIPPTSRASVLTSAETKHRKRIPPRVIAAICVSMASIVVGLTIALILYAKHRRRVAKHGTTAVDHDANTVSPFMLSTQMDGHTNKTTPRRGPEVRSVSRSTIARQHLETELRMVHEKMVDLQHRETDRERSSTGPTAGSRTHRMLRLPSMRRSSTRGSPDVQAQLEASREQIDMLVMRIHALEANANSPYGARVSNELPPSYV